MVDAVLDDIGALTCGFNAVRLGTKHDPSPRDLVFVIRCLAAGSEEGLALVVKATDAAVAAVTGLLAGAPEAEAVKARAAGALCVLGGMLPLWDAGALVAWGSMGGSDESCKRALESARGRVVAIDEEKMNVVDLGGKASQVRLSNVLPVEDGVNDAAELPAASLGPAALAGILACLSLEVPWLGVGWCDCSYVHFFSQWVRFSALRLTPLTTPPPSHTHAHAHTHTHSQTHRI